MLTLNQTNLQQQASLALIHQMNQEPKHKEDKRLVSLLPRLNMKCKLIFCAVKNNSPIQYVISCLYSCYSTAHE